MAVEVMKWAAAVAVCALALTCVAILVAVVRGMFGSDEEPEEEESHVRRIDLG